MVIYSTVQSRCYIININNTGIGVHRNFSIDRQSRHFACLFQSVDDTMQMGVHITLYPFYTAKKMTQHLAATVPKTRFAGSKVPFSHRIKVRNFLQSAVIVSLHYAIQMSSKITCDQTPTTAPWTERLLPCYCYAMKANFRTIRTQVS